MDFLKLANLRPGLPVGSLADAIGESWKAPEFHQLGLVKLAAKNEKKFSARLDEKQIIGELRYSTGFPESHRIEGLFVCMLLSKALAVRPQFTPFESQGTGENPETATFIDRSEPGYDIVINTKGQLVSNIILRSRDAVFPAFEPAAPNLKQAFNIWPSDAKRIPESARGSEWHDGWLFGLPPGISSQHWPLHPRHGYPLRHAFTLRLPPDYRVKGQELVALSLFVGDMAENAPKLDGFVPQLMVSHPQSFAMEDVICRKYVGIWLTQDEFEGPPCHPPMTQTMAASIDFNEIKWIAEGYSASFPPPRGEDGVRLKWPEGAAGTDLGVAFPLTVVVRDEDPNVGLPPRDEDGDESSYISMFSEQGEELGLERFHEAPHVHHLGGTMYGDAGRMHFGPYYLEFHQDFGGCNLAGGDIQIDLKRMALNWSR